MHDQSHYKIDDTPSNSNYQHDIHYTFEMCQWVLKPIGIWPLVYSRTSRLEKIVSIALLTACSFVLLFSIIPPGRYILFEEKNIYKKMKLMGSFGFCLSSTIKYFYLVLKSAALERCLVHVEKDWKTVEDSNHRTIMLRQGSISRNLIGLCAVFLYTGGMSYHTMMPFLSKARIKGNTTQKPLIYPGYDAFFDTQISPTYEIIFSIHCFCGFIKYSVTTGAYSLCTIFITHICGQIQIQVARLNDLTRKKEKSHDPLGIVIRNHVKILRLSKNVEEAMREICLTEIMEGTLIICLLEYYCMMEWQNSDMVAIVTYFILLTSFVFNLLIFCYIGEILTEQCSQIGPASYEIEWYNLSPKKAQSLILLSAVSLYPPKLTAGKFVVLNFKTFSSVMQSSVVYFNLLRTFTD
ncbi:odorant receptor 13a-like [Calliopsis andreniformis]|uniref:odorant receptor 13a-like n=1 Tax=Calliopsis andreniformis TaxID=337506 RepID=UPI003FCC2919